MAHISGGSQAITNNNAYNTDDIVYLPTPLSSSLVNTQKSVQYEEKNTKSIIVREKIRLPKVTQRSYPDRIYNTTQ